MGHDFSAQKNVQDIFIPTLNRVAQVAQKKEKEKNCSEMCTQNIPSQQELHCIWYLMH